MDRDTWVLVASVLGSAVAAALTMFFATRPRLSKALRAAQDAEAASSALANKAEQTRKAMLLEAKEEAIRLRDEAEDEIRSKRRALDSREERLNARDEQIEDRRKQLEIREQTVAESSQKIVGREAELSKRTDEFERELQHLSGLDRDAARELYLKRVEVEFREIGIRKAREIELETVAEAQRRAKRHVLDVMERCTTEYVTEATIAVVALPNEDMKGRIIGREGRNIRSFEQVTGVDLIIDDTPEAVVISCFDPVRRETARLALMNLMMDGRIHPGRIEELYEKAQAEVARMIEEAGEHAAERANVRGLHPRIIEMMGRLRFRTSYAQNVLDHSVETAHLASMLASELSLNLEITRRAAFLHDIGKALGPEWDGPHALTGMEFLRQHGVKDPILHAVGAHHHDIEPNSEEAVAVIIADSLSAARPGARRENLDNYVKRLESLESLATAFPGVERAYALQAGREIRLVVKPLEIDDLGAARLANEVARRIESEMEYPGQIKVTVIRETRVHETAR